MRTALLLAVGLVTASCRKETPPASPPRPALWPGEVTLEGAYHAVQCGAVTAVWSGSAEGLKDLPQPAPKHFGVESLAFRFAEGTSKGFKPVGQLFFSDWRFDVFSPDCRFIALLVDRYGPYHLVKTESLRGYLEGRVKPVHVQALGPTEALVHGDGLWTAPDAFEFTASCCGGAQAFRADVESGSLTRLLDAPSAPRGLRRTVKGWEPVP
jgi:hypothetical protein